MRKNRKVNTVYLVQMALLIAIILIMAFTPIGYIRTLGMDITLIVVPVAVGAVVLGPMAGTVLGAVF
ncbi:MAG: ECF transporter S component, partial [Lachnospiraceae bacterium]